MIEKIEVYIVVCKCGEQLDANGDGGYTVYTEEISAKEALQDEEWEISNTGEVICGSCIVERDKK